MSFNISVQVAASQDPHGFQYKMVYRLQRSREEMIVDLADIMKEQIMHFSGKHNRRPDRIIYFRDGVSEGQFQQVQNIMFTEFGSVKINL